MDSDADLSQKVFVLINFVSKVEVEKLKFKVRRLGGQVVENDDTWNPRITHIVSDNFLKAEIVLAG